MYTVGQVAKFLGISRDTLKFYEEKNLINPKQDEENGYRKYNIIDINEAVTVNFYRDIDIEIKKIQEIRQGDSIDTIESILDEKAKKLEEEIEYKRLLLNRIKGIKEDCKSIEESLNKFTIREMKPIEITNEITMKDEINETYSEILEKDMDEKREVISYTKCIYIVIAVPIFDKVNNIDENMAASITETAKELGYETLGIAFINLLINGYKDGKNIQYLEIYTPVI